MAIKTSRLGFTLPGYEDAADIGVINQNFETVERRSVRWDNAAIWVTANIAPDGTMELSGEDIPDNKDGITIQFISPAIATDSLQVRFSDNDKCFPIVSINEGKEPISAGVWDVGVPVSLIFKGEYCFFRLGAGDYGTLPPQTKISAKAGNAKITITLSVPKSPYFAGTLLVRKEGSDPQKVSDGVKIDVGTATTYTDEGLTNKVEYHYRAFSYGPKKKYQTELSGALATAIPVAWQIPTFTGSGYVSGNEEKGKYYCLSSGTLTLDKGIYDVFVVGGGASGNRSSSDDQHTIGAGGGGSGYTSTKKRISVANGNYAVVVGSGGAELIEDGRGNSGGTSSINLNGTIVSASGCIDNTGDREDGLDGGSGGGAGGWRNAKAGDGGSDGGNGANNTVVRGDPGKGQGATTREFGELSGVLYAGGGGGGCSHTNQQNSDEIGIGGAGGGGSGGNSVYEGYYIFPTAGVVNTGGGGGGSGTGYSRSGAAGGSGIVIIRWGY